MTLNEKDELRTGWHFEDGIVRVMLKFIAQSSEEETEREQERINIVESIHLSFVQ
jgi:hypothetical protein